MMRVLLTGASGFIGSRVAAQLVQKDLDLHIVSRRPSPVAPPQAKVHLADLLDAGALRAVVDEVRPTHLLHLAWDVTPGLYWNARNNLDWVSASLALFRAFERGGGQRAVFAGTCAEYDWTAGSVLGPQAPLAAATLYGQAKDSLRRLILAGGSNADVSTAWGRIFWLYGPNEPSGRLVSDTADALLNGRPAACSAGWQERDFLHVDDVASAFVAALNSDFRGAFDIGSGAPVAVRDVVMLLGELTNRPDLINLGALPSRPEPPRLVSDSTILRERIGWTPRFDLRTGLEDTLSVRARAGKP